MMPMPLEARGVGKNAADRLPSGKEKEKWKDKGKAARKAAKATGADEVAVAAAGLAARTKAEAAYMTTETSIKGLERMPGEPETQPEPPAPELPPARELPPAPQMSSQKRAMLDLAMSKEAALMIIAAYTVFHRSHPSRLALGHKLEHDDKLEHAQVSLKHGLRRLAAAYPDFKHWVWEEQSAGDVVFWTVRVHAAGHPIPAAVAVAQRTHFDLEKVAADYRAAPSAAH
jgi:hypothetical protein